MITKNGKIKCDKCGKFIGFHADARDIVIRFTPDSHFSKEVIEHRHPKCQIENNKTEDKE